MPIINVPEVGIVTMEAITKRAVVVSTDDGDVIAIRPVMNMVLGRRPPRQRRRRRRGAAARHQGLARGRRPGHRDLLRPRRARGTVLMRSSSPAEPGSSGARVVARLRDRGDAGRRARPRPGEGPHGLTALGAELGRRRPLRHRPPSRRDLEAPTRVIHAAGIVPDRDHRRRAAGDVGRERRHDRRGSSTRRSRPSVPRIVYVSTVNVFGNTHGRIVDETYRRDLAAGLPSATTTRPSTGRTRSPSGGSRPARPSSSRCLARSYGPGDHTVLGEQLVQCVPRARCRTSPLADIGHRAGPRRRRRGGHRRGPRARRGRRARTCLAGDCIRFGEALRSRPTAGGERCPDSASRTGSCGSMAPFGRLVGQREPARGGRRRRAGVTYWASSQRRRRTSWASRRGTLEHGPSATRLANA